MNSSNGLVRMIDEAITLNDGIPAAIHDKRVIARLENDGTAMFLDTELGFYVRLHAVTTLFDDEASALQKAKLYQNGNGGFTAMQVKQVSQHVRTHLTNLKLELEGGL